MQQVKRGILSFTFKNIFLLIFFLKLRPASQFMTKKTIGL